MAINISIIVPSTDERTINRFIQPLQDLDYHLPIKPTFFFLINTKNNFSEKSTRIIENEKYTSIIVHSQYYLGSCEENIFRIRDFFDLLTDNVLVIGDTDEIHWLNLYKLLQLKIQSESQVAAFQVQNVQINRKGDSVKKNLLPDAYDLVSKRYRWPEGLVRNAFDEFMLKLAKAGPLDWAAFIGTHIYSKVLFLRILQYEFKEPMYSLIFMQIKTYSTSFVPYVYFPECVVVRRGNELAALHQGLSWGWQVEHRHMRGDSPQCSIGMLSLMLEIADLRSFNLILNSICYRHRLDNEGIEIQNFENFFFKTAIRWCHGVLENKIRHKSYYFPDICSSGSLKDLALVYHFLKYLSEIISSVEMYSRLIPKIFPLISEANSELKKYLEDCSLVNIHFVNNSLYLLLKLENLLVDELLADLHEKSLFEHSV